MAFELVSNDTTKEFSDVKANSWYYGNVMSLYNLGIVNGLGEERFGIGNELSREDLAVITVRVAKHCGINLPKRTEITFVDDSLISDYAKESVSSLSSCGIMTGYNNEFSPKDSVTRAMAAKIIYELLKISN